MQSFTFTFTWSPDGGTDVYVRVEECPWRWEALFWLA